MERVVHHTSRCGDGTGSQAVAGRMLAGFRLGFGWVTAGCPSVAAGGLEARIYAFCFKCIFIWEILIQFENYFLARLCN